MEILGRYKYFAIFLIALFTFLYVDFWSHSWLGILVSVLLFIVFSTISLLDLSKGIIITLLYSLLIIEFPRDILDVYSALQVENTIQYNVLNTVKIGPFTLFVYLVFFNAFMVLLKSKKLKLNFLCLVLLAILLLIGLSSMLRIFLLQGYLHYPNLIITDIKFILFVLAGMIQGSYLFRKNKIDQLLGVIMIVPAIIGLRSIFFLFSDILAHKSNLDLMTNPYLSLGVLTVLLIKGDWGIYKNWVLRILLLLSLLNPSRGFFVLAFLFVFCALSWKFYRKIPFNSSFIIQAVLIIGLVFIGIFIFNERLYNFFIWKLNVFSELFNEKVDTSGSGKVRYLELSNVVTGLSQSLYETLFGKGFAATYDFSHHPIRNVGVIDLKSYSKDQLTSGVYYTTHSFITGILLKYGLSGLFIYLFLPFRIILFYLRKRKYLLFVILPVLLIYSYYSRIEFMLLIGILIGSIQKRNAQEHV
ncbi:hypothetical protein [Aquimarina sp. I32.4]|uniref:hypothetical protein n=1 Tax=Aquimarina sp. I32.4 TaxID=2053903 RepID=UPI000CDF14E5|nr:hypothetical protein [Aquimarina sp. I32.4]